MEVHVNGWPAIERQLQRLEKRQGEIALLLGMTPAAVSQVKKGSFLLNPRQLEKVAQFLKFDEEIRNDFYSELFNARLVCRDAQSQRRNFDNYRVSLSARTAVRRKRHNEIPLADVGILAGYEPVLESLVEYLLRNSPERKNDAPFEPGACALRVSDEVAEVGLPQGSLIMIDTERYPEPGSLNFVVLQDGSCMLREYHPEGDLIRLSAVLRDTGADLIWRRGQGENPVFWMHPVLEMTVRPPL